MKENELTKYQNGAVQTMPSITAAEEFVKRLNERPPQEETKVNTAANNSKYLPISFIQMKLDEVYAGLWQTRNFTTKVVANEIIGEIELLVFNPVINQWVSRTGAAAVMIQQRKDSDITDLGAKIKNTLVKDYAHLMAECLKSAAKTLGKAFGRDLNRQFEDSYTPIYGDEISAMEALEPIIGEIDKCKTMDELMSIWNQFPDQHGNGFFKKHFASKRQSLNLKK